MSKLYAVVEPKGNTIKSKWFVADKGKLKEVTSTLYKDVNNYNKIIKGKTQIPYTLKNGLIEYAYGCGLTHYLQDDNLKEVTTLGVTSIDVWTVNDLKMYTKGTDWEKDLELALKERGQL